LSRTNRNYGSALLGQPGRASAGPNPLVAEATALCQRGRLDEAEALLRGVLSFAPRDHAALHMLGVIAHRKGDHPRAVDFYRQAIAINGRVVAYHGDLGNAYFETRRHEDAARCFRRTLALEPSSALAHFGLGLALLGQKAYSAAAKELETAGKARPDHADTHLNFAIALTELGRLDEAIAHARRAVALNPGYAGSHLRLGIALRGKGEFGAARGHLTRAVELAVAQYQIAIAPRALEPPDHGIHAPKQVLVANPELVELLTQLGGVLYDLRQFDEAIGCYERALALAPGSPTMLHAIGRARYRQGRFEESRAAYIRAIELEPGNAENYWGVGRIYEAEGRFDKAIAWQEKALAHQPDHSLAHYSLVMMRSSADREARVRQLEQILAQGSPDPNRCAPLNFALAKLYDEGADYDQAFRYFKAGNDLRKAAHRYQPGEEASLIDRLTASLSKGLFDEKERIGSRSERPVFIIGMPRSGTTLVEQILASHPQIHGHGEVDHITELVIGLAERLEGRQPYPECLAALDANTAGCLAEEYLGQLERVACGAARSVDKMPHNFFHLGVIALLFPQARLLHCVRDPIDTCLSCYFHDFGLRHPFSWDLEQLGHYYRDYQRLMAHWHATLPNPILDVPYEGLVGDQEVWSRKLIDFLGLPWDERCLAYYETNRPVTTSSSWQVRQPIYASSIGRWQHYVKHLGPLFSGLGWKMPRELNGPLLEALGIVPPME
jgi:tetratricopeptide (TPR) repeat protein